MYMEDPNQFPPSSSHILHVEVNVKHGKVGENMSTLKDRILELGKFHEIDMR